jgi:hypothetical protein
MVVVVVKEEEQFNGNNNNNGNFAIATSMVICTLELFLCAVKIDHRDRSET